MENSTLPQLEITQASHLNVFHEDHRFILESVLILLSVGANAFGLIVVVMTQSNSKQKSVYHILYIYVSATNIAACLVTWFCGNLSFLFRDWFQQNITSNSLTFCQAVVYKHLALPISLSVAILMNIAMLGLAICQYFAICKPLESVYYLQKRRAYVFIGLSLSAFAVCACVSLSVLIIRATSMQCVNGNYIRIQNDALIIVNTFTAIIVLLYIFMVAVGIRVYVEIRSFSERTKRLSRQKSVNACERRLATDKRAYTATMVLILSRTLFTMPLAIYFVYDLNRYGYHHNVTVFYLTVFPCIKCIFDPVIYGAFMRDVGKTIRQLSCSGKRRSSDLSKLTSSTRFSRPLSTSNVNTISGNFDNFVKRDGAAVVNSSQPDDVRL